MGALNYDLLVFLHARLDEDEQAAKAVLGVGEERRVHSADGRSLIHDEANQGSLTDVRAKTADGQAVVRYTARQGPARVLAGVAAVRGVLAEAEQASHAATTGKSAVTRGTGSLTLAALEPVLCHLATTYADHPDYRAEWTPRSSWD
ncbi:DUF6221 family protein [Streptomyces sp. NPDC058864]